jgi:class 3 adenylate cyclase
MDTSVRFGIAAKIFGGMFALVLVMGAASVASMLLVRQVTQELMFVEGAYLPIARTVAAIVTAAAEQEVQFERAAGRIKGARPGDPEDAVHAFVALGREIDAAVGVALDQLRAAAAGTRDVDHRIALVRLEGKLVQLEREHQDIEDEALRILGVLRGNHVELGDALLERLEREQAEFDAAGHAAANAAAELAAAASAKALVHEHRVLRINILLTTLAVILGLLFSLLIVRGLTRPVRALVAATGQIERGNLQVQVPVLTRDEIGDLAISFNRMAGELRIKEQIKATFGRYVDPRIVEHLMSEQGGGIAAGESGVYTVYFSDISGFTGIAERLTPESLVKLINAYLTAMSTPLRESKGIIDKYIGDAIMAYWGPPFTGADEHARLACTAAVRQQGLLEDFQAEIPGLTGLRRDAPRMRMRIGIATGEVVVGSIGSDFSRNYTVMGDTVNLGARLEGLNKVYGTHILVNSQTRTQAGDAFLFREIDQVTVVGKQEAERIYELMAADADATGDQRRLQEVFGAALAAYRGRDWDRAEAEFRRCRQIAPEDGPAAVYLERIAGLRATPPPDDWDGAWRATSK